MFDLIPTGIPGCLEIRPYVRHDMRGRFVKVFQRDFFAANGLNTEYAEDYYSISQHNVLRGLHFQTPPMDHFKVVYCVAGRVQDVALDIRVGSPTYGRHVVVELSADTGNMLYLPPGLAHGFCTLSESATLIYKVSTVHAPQCDGGILWNSAGIAWATDAPILSARDRKHPPLPRFASPFIFELAP